MDTRLSRGLAHYAEPIKEVREISQATTSMNALLASYSNIFCGDYAAAKAQPMSLSLWRRKSAPKWKAVGTALAGFILAMTGKASDAVPAITSGMLDSAQPEQLSTNHSHPIWPVPMRNLASLTMLGVALTTR